MKEDIFNHISMKLKGIMHHNSSNLLDKYLKYVCTLIFHIDCKRHCYDYFTFTCATFKNSKVEMILSLSCKLSLYTNNNFITHLRKQRIHMFTNSIFNVQICKIAATCNNFPYIEEVFLNFF